MVGWCNGDCAGFCQIKGNIGTAITFCSVPVFVYQWAFGSKNSVGTTTKNWRYGMISSKATYTIRFVRKFLYGGYIVHSLNKHCTHAMKPSHTIESSKPTATNFFLLVFFFFFLLHLYYIWISCIWCRTLIKYLCIARHVCTLCQKTLRLYVRIRIFIQYIWVWIYNWL